jgi:hypothetical protein
VSSFNEKKYLPWFVALLALLSLGLVSASFLLSSSQDLRQQASGNPYSSCIAACQENGEVKSASECERLCSNSPDHPTPSSPPKECQTPSVGVVASGQTKTVCRSNTTGRSYECHNGELLISLEESCLVDNERSSGGTGSSLTPQETKTTSIRAVSDKQVVPGVCGEPGLPFCDFCNAYEGGGSVRTNHCDSRYQSGTWVSQVCKNGVYVDLSPDERCSQISFTSPTCDLGEIKCGADGTRFGCVNGQLIAFASQGECSQYDSGKNSDGSEQGSETFVETVQGQGSLFLQTYFPEFKNNGCGPTTVANILGSFGISEFKRDDGTVVNLTPVTLIHEFYTPYMMIGGTSAHENFGVLQQFGATVDPIFISSVPRQTIPSEELRDIIDYLDAGSTLFVGARVFDTNHFVWVTGYNHKTGEFVGYDPYFTQSGAVNTEEPNLVNFTAMGEDFKFYEIYAVSPP